MALKPSDILALSKAGYNSAQIALIAQGIQAEAQTQAAAPAQAQTQAAAPAPAQTQAAAPAQAQTQAAAPAPAPAPAPAEKPDLAPTYDGIMAELQKISGAMFAGNIANSQQPAQQTPEDIIAAIIRPPQPADK